MTYTPEDDIAPDEFDNYEYDGKFTNGEEVILQPIKYEENYPQFFGENGERLPDFLFENPVFIKSLLVNECPIRNLDPRISLLINLENLNLELTDLQSLPTEITQLKHLQRLNIPRCKFT